MRREYCRKNGFSVTYTDNDVCFEKSETAEAMLIGNDGKMLINNFDNETTALLKEWYGRIYKTIVSFRTLDRIEEAV